MTVYTAYSERTLTDACKTVLGSDVVDACLRTRISLPRIVDMAVRRCFVTERVDENADIIRSAVKDLDGQHAVFRFSAWVDETGTMIYSEDLDERY